MTIQSLKKVVTNGLIVLGLSFGLTLSATAATDFEEVKALAEEGDSLSQNLLGNYYREGDGVRQDLSKAFYWYQKSANQGDLGGQFYVAYSYATGEGVRQDEAKAFYWYQKSANQNNRAAQHSVGAMYEFGKGVRQNHIIAKEWYGKACDNGYQSGCDRYKKLNELGY